MNRRHLRLNIVIVVLAICFILATSKPVNAQEAGYSHTCYTTSLATLPTINGQWGSEWNYGLQTTFGTNANFTDEWYLAGSSPSIVYYYLLVETMDNSNETGDFIQICFNGGMTADSAPSPTDFAINFTSNAVCTWYQGNGVGWRQIATPSLSVFQWSESFSPSPTNSVPHLILEMSLLKTSTELGGSQIIGPEFWMLLQTYDAHVAGSAVQSWPTVPPSSPDVPKTYGDIPYSTSAAPNYVLGSNQTPNATPTSTPSPTPAPTQKASPTPTIVHTPNPTTNPTTTPTPNPTQPPSPTPQLKNESTFNSWDILFVLAIISAESAVVVIYRIAPAKKSINRARKQRI
jgi:hypothetical protein